MIDAGPTPHAIAYSHSRGFRFTLGIAHVASITSRCCPVSAIPCVTRIASSSAAPAASCSIENAARTGDGRLRTDRTPEIAGRHRG